MGKSDLLKDSMKSGLDGLLSSTKKSPQKKEATPLKTEKEPAVHCNFVIDKSVHTRMKFLAIEKNMSLRDIVNEAMKEYLETKEYAVIPEEDLLEQAEPEVAERLILKRDLRKAAIARMAANDEGRIFRCDI